MSNWVPSAEMSDKISWALVAAEIPLLVGGRAATAVQPLIEAEALERAAKFMDSKAKAWRRLGGPCVRELACEFEGAAATLRAMITKEATAHLPAQGKRTVGASDGKG